MSAEQTAIEAVTGAILRYEQRYKELEADYLILADEVRAELAALRERIERLEKLAGLEAGRV